MIENLKKAIERIEEKYFDRNERDFAYELYYQLRQEKYPDNVEVTCETPKKRFKYDDKILNDTLVRRYFFRDEINENRRIFRYPDLLIHEYENRKQQLAVIEIKKQLTPDNLKRDLAKLVVYCLGRLKYKVGILIIISPNRSRNQLLEIPDIRRFLTEFREIQIWIVKPNIEIEIICSNNI
jgi:hypothetical protein